jgi:hypothetical protein
MRKRKFKSVSMVFLLFAGFIFVAPLFPVSSNITWIAMGDRSWVPTNYESYYEQGQGINVRAEINYSYDDDGFGGGPGWKIIVITMFPEEITVSIIFEVEYVKVQDEYVPVYFFYYNGVFLYGNPANTTIYFPLPYGTITDLFVKVNDQTIEKPIIAYNQIKINLTEENSTVSVAFNSYGAKRYSHEVPKNIFVENLTFQVNIRNIDTENINLDKSLAPSSKSSKNSVSLEWDNTNTIMRKDIVIEMLPKKAEDFSEFLMNFLYGLLFMGVLISAFYFEGFKRLKHEKKVENLFFLLLPYFLLAILLWTLVFWIGIINALSISLIGFATASLLIDRKAIKISKGIWEFFLIPTFLLLFFVGLIVEEGFLGASLTLISSLLLIGLFTLFFVRHPRHIKNESMRFRNKKSEIPNKKGEISKGSIIPNSLDIKESLINKNFCPHCGSKIGSDFTFCPKCGQDISTLVRCRKCGFLGKITDEESFCPNCGSVIKQRK